MITAVQLAEPESQPAGSHSTLSLLLQAIQYLEQELKDSPTALVLVSHDRW